MGRRQFEARVIADTDVVGTRGLGLGVTGARIVVARQQTLKRPLPHSLAGGRGVGEGERGICMCSSTPTMVSTNALAVFVAGEP